MSWIRDDALNFGVAFNSIESWLAVAGTRKLVADTGCEINFLPVLKTLGNVAGDSQTSDDPLAAYKARRARARRQFADAELRRSCARLDISEDQGRRQFDGSVAARGLLVARQRPTAAVFEFLTAVFEAAYRDGAAIEEVGTIETLLGEPLAASDDDLTAVNDALTEAGVFSSPAFVFEGERFHGRQHLPLLRWTLSGREGIPPV